MRLKSAGKTLRKEWIATEYVRRRVRRICHWWTGRNECGEDIGKAPNQNITFAHLSAPLFVRQIHRDGKVIRIDQDNFLNMSSASDRSSELVSRLRE